MSPDPRSITEKPVLACAFCGRAALDSHSFLIGLRGAICKICLQICNLQMLKHASQMVSSAGATALGLNRDTLYRALVMRNPSLPFRLEDVDLDTELLRLLPLEVWRKHLVVPLFSIENVIVVAMEEWVDAEPFIQDFGRYCPEYDLEVLERPKESCEKAISRLETLMTRTT